MSSKCVFVMSLLAASVSGQATLLEFSGQLGGNFGVSMDVVGDVVGDVDGDGVGDVAIGSHEADGAVVASGTVTVASGATGQVLAVLAAIAGFAATPGLVVEIR